jgi:pentapeptide repeat protein
MRRGRGLRRRHGRVHWPILRGCRFERVGLSGAWFGGFGLSGAVMRGAELSGAGIRGEIAGLAINGGGIGPAVVQ